MPLLLLLLLLLLLQVADDGLEARIVTQATNTNAGCVNGVDANGNPCVTKQKKDPICKVCSAISWQSSSIMRLEYQCCWDMAVLCAYIVCSCPTGC
jgi:hypothetical protein